MRKTMVLSAIVLSLVMLASQGFADEGGNSVRRRT